MKNFFSQYKPDTYFSFIKTLPSPWQFYIFILIIQIWTAPHQYPDLEVMQFRIQIRITFVSSSYGIANPQIYKEKDSVSYPDQNWFASIFFLTYESVSAIACLQELVLHLICLLYTTTDALTDDLTDVCTKCVFYVPDIMQAMYIYMGRYL